MFTTPPGTSEVASTSASETAGSGDASLASTTAVFPPTIAGASRETSPSSDWSLGATMPTTPVGSGIVKLKYGPATGFDAPEHLRDLVGPSRVPDPAVDRGVHAAVRVGGAGVGQLVAELRAPALHQLGHAVEDLTPVVRGHARPTRVRRARRHAPRRAASLRDACAA